jgi:hypothetical protein
MSGDTSVASTVTRDNLFSGPTPTPKFGAVNVGASQTIVRGSVLGLITAGAVTSAAVVGSGAETIGSLALAAGGPAKPGAWLATCITAGAAGLFEVTDPDGKTVGVVATSATFTGGGITFVITDAGTDPAVGDYFAITVAAGAGTAQVLDKAATNGTQKIYGIAMEPLTTAGGGSGRIAVALRGSFASQAVSFASGTVIADVADDARLKGIYFDTSYAAGNAVGG